jgi:hypothetical protein
MTNGRPTDPPLTLIEQTTEPGIDPTIESALADVAQW